MNFIPTSVNTTDPGYVAGWMPSMPSPTCTIDAAGQALNITNSNVLISACNPATQMPANVKAFQGPIQAYVFARTRKLWPLIVSHGVLDFIALIWR